MDIHVDHIFPFLHIEDILCLRRSNKAFFLLTHEPIIWKRFLSKLTIPLPPLRPTFRYALEATDFEIEQLVTRSISLEDNWRHPHPRILCTRAVFAHYTVLDLRILPGGKYLVASVKDTGDFRYFLVVFCLDHPHGPRPLARYPLKSKAVYLQAKYDNYRGNQVVLLSFVCRSFEPGGPLNLDPNEYGTGVKLDPPHPLENNLTCIRINTSSLEAMADPRIPPGSEALQEIASSQLGPFFEIASIVSHRELAITTIFDIDDDPHVSVVEQPATIVVANLNRNTFWRIQCRHPLFENYAHCMRAVRHIPKQRQLLVIHTAALSKHVHHHFLALYDVPVVDTEVVSVHGRECVDLLSGPTVAHFHISDYGIPRSDEKTFTFRRDSFPPPPISIFMETIDPPGVRHVVIWPSANRHPVGSPYPLKTNRTSSSSSSSSSYFYSLAHVVPQTTHYCPPNRARVLAGAYRTIVYTISATDRRATPGLVSLRRYVNLEYQTEDYPLPRVPKSAHGILRKKHPPLPRSAYASCDDGLDPETRARYAKDGIAAMTWDEGIGRLCMASKDSDCIDIVDFAHVVQPGHRFSRWVRCQEYVRGNDLVPLRFVHV